MTQDLQILINNTIKDLIYQRNEYLCTIDNTDGYDVEVFGSLKNANGSYYEIEPFSIGFDEDREIADFMEFCEGLVEEGFIPEKLLLDLRVLKNGRVIVEVL